VTVDREGSNWLGTSNNGIAPLSPHYYVTFSAPEGLLDEILDGRRGALAIVWIGKRRGCSRMIRAPASATGRS
jgi:hypothetical protein